LRCTVGTAQASLAAGDYFMLNQYVEGPRWRELSMDVHSVSLLVRSSVAGLAFGVYLRDPSGPPIRSLLKLCTIPASNTWALIPLANLPLWAAGGAWSSGPGVLGYTFGICLATGTTFTVPANDVWQNGNYTGAVGQSNFLATAGATFDIAFVQHEPGALCTTPIDCPFTQNLDDCWRYYEKSYPYATAVGATSASSYASFYLPTAASGAVALYSNARFKKTKAKVPTCVGYNPSNGAANTGTFWSAPSGTICNTSQNGTINSIGASQDGIIYLTANITSTAPPFALAEWTADTGW
jgi:hypothetical protein